MATMMTKTAPKTSVIKSTAKNKTASKKCKSTACATKTTKSASTKTATAKSATAQSMEFTLYAPHATEVYLVGDFNNWDGREYRMRKFKDGVCKKTVKLKPGQYEYLFVVDGEWWIDPNNAARTQNPYGSQNSVITVG